MKAVEPTGRFRERPKPGTGIADEALELADDPETREKTMLSRFFNNLASNPKSAGLAALEGMAEQSGHMEADRSIVPDAPSDTSAYENAMMILNEVRDDLTRVFPKIGDNKDLYRMFADSIHRIEDGMKKLGMEVEPFSPLTNLSGLSAGDEMLVNANKVVENTSKRYTLHRIADIRASVKRGIPSIEITIEGEDSGTRFRAKGVVSAPKDFTGNEAIDFVTKAGECALSVKAINLGRTVDVSDRFVMDFDVDSMEDDPPKST